MNTEQIETTEGKITTISLGNMTKEAGQVLAAKLNGQTYMNFEILVCPNGGSWTILAQSFYDGTIDEILGMFLFLMATELSEYCDHSHIDISKRTCKDCGVKIS